MHIILLFYICQEIRLLYIIMFNVSCISGKLVIVSGINNGIGQGTVLKALKHNATVSTALS